MKDIIAGILLPVSNTIYDIFYAIPLWAVKGGIFTVLALLAFWVIRMRPQLPAKDESHYSLDLRWFALFVLGMQVILYIIF